MKYLQIIGNLGRDAETRTSAKGNDLMRFSVAVKSRNGETIWVNVLMNMREYVFPYLKKGRQVFVAGDFDLSLYKGTVSVDLFADRIELCGGKSETQTEEIADGAVTTKENELTAGSVDEKL